MNKMALPNFFKFCRLNEFAFFDRRFTGVGNLLCVHFVCQFSKLIEYKLLTIWHFMLQESTSIQGSSKFCEIKIGYWKVKSIGQKRKQQ